MKKQDVRCCICSKGENDKYSNGERRTFAMIGDRHICYECAYDANLQFELQASENCSKVGPNFNIRHFISFLDKYVAGQNEAKKAIAMQVYHQFSRSRNPKGNYPRSGLLVLGPTGSGKTLLAETAAKYLGSIVRKFDMTQFTSAGYVGRDVEEIVRGVYEAAGRNVAKAETAIVILDEIDKIARSKNENGKDVNGEGVQQALLTILDGNDIPFRMGQGNYVTINTSRMLFICSGAFSGLTDIIKKRTTQSSIGFRAEVNKKQETSDTDLMKNVSTQDLVSFGLMPEFVGRMARYVVLDKLSKEMLVTIMKESSNSVIRKYNSAFSDEGIKLIFTDSAFKAVAEKAYAMGTGARALNGILTEVLDDILYDILSNRRNVMECIVTEEVINNKDLPRYIYKQFLEERKYNLLNG